MLAETPAVLCLLRHTVAKIEERESNLDTDARALSFGLQAIDTALHGGLAPASLHEVAPATPREFGATVGFILALAARAVVDLRNTLWIQTDFAARATGNLYGLGCELFGLPSSQLLVLKVPRPLDVLWAMEEALKCRALTSVIAELPHDNAAADLIATRRLTLAAHKGGGFGFLLHHRSLPLSSSAETRWEIAAAASHPDQFGGLGRPAFTLSLIKNRRGPTGQWTLAWNHHERAFSPLSVGVAQAAFDRPDRTPLIRVG